jgi:hypothetical protein
MTLELHRLQSSYFIEILCFWCNYFKKKEKIIYLGSFCWNLQLAYVVYIIVSNSKISTFVTFKKVNCNMLLALG